MQIGIIAWYESNKKFGVIKTINEEFFLHHTNWKDKTEIKVENKIPVIFEDRIIERKKSGTNCKYFDINNVSH